MTRARGVLRPRDTTKRPFTFDGSRLRRAPGLSRAGTGIVIRAASELLGGWPRQVLRAQGVDGPSDLGDVDLRFLAGSLGAGVRDGKDGDLPGEQDPFS